ncbi:MAG TPA: tyrosine-type recombinase/integrase [Byssovorax sp.]
MDDNSTDDAPSAELTRALVTHPLVAAAAITLDPRAAYLASLAPSSRRTMASALSTIASWLGLGSHELPWHLVRRVHADAIRARLLVGYAPATANRLLAALRGVLRAARRLRLIELEDHELAVGVARVGGERLPRGRALAASELRALFAACDPRTPIGARDAALLALLYGTGLRRAEAAGLALADVGAEGAIRILGKGNRERLVHATGGVARALARWLDVRGAEPGPLLAPVTRGGRVKLRRLNDHAVFVILRGLAARARVAPFSPHDCRRSFISDLLDVGVDIATVQRMAGHRDVTTTARYDRRPEQAKRRAAELLHVPFADGD